MRGGTFDVRSGWPPRHFLAPSVEGDRDFSFYKTVYKTYFFLYYVVLRRFVFKLKNHGRGAKAKKLAPLPEANTVLF